LSGSALQLQISKPKPKQRALRFNELGIDKTMAS
jgi:hypothetical protein